MTREYSLPKSMRLAEAEAQAVFKDGFHVRSPATRASLQSKAAPATSFRFAPTVPKRIVPRAVDRNAVKRHLREAIRHDTIRETSIAVIITLRCRPTLTTKRGREAFRAVVKTHLSELVAGVAARSRKAD